MNAKRERILAKFKQPKLFARFVSAAVDAACFLLVAFGGSILSSYVVTNSDEKYIASSVMANEHIASCNLCHYDETNGYLKYELDDLGKINDDQMEFVNVLSDYYLSYLTGQNLKENHIASLNYDKTMADGKLPKEYYTVQWFNEEILEIGKEKSFFTYIVKEGNPDKTVLGHLKDEYIEIKEIDGVSKKSVKNDEELIDFVNNKYNSAVQHFYGQDFITEANTYTRIIQSVTIFVSTLLSACIFYLIIPCCNQFGITIGKKIMGLIVLNDNGLMIDRWRLALRCIPLVAGAGIVAFVPNLYLQIICTVLLFLVSLTLAIFTPHKMALHDFIGRTVVVSREDAVVCVTVEQYDILYAEEEKQYLEENQENERE